MPTNCIPALLLAWLLGGFFSAFAQIESAKYYRYSASYLLVDSHLPEPYRAKTLEVWEKKSSPKASRWDVNDIESGYLTVPTRQLTDSAVKAALLERKIPNELVAYWWSQDSTGSYSTERVIQRGLATASVKEMEEMDDRKRSISAVADDGEKLLDNSLIVVYDFRNFKTYQEIYDEIDRRNRERANNSKGKIKFEPVERVYRGYKGDVTVRIYRLKFLGEPAAVFYNDMWVDASTDEGSRAQRLAKFEAYPFPVELMTTKSFDISGSQRRDTESKSSGSNDELVNLISTIAKGVGKPKTMDDLFAEMIASGRGKAYDMLMELTVVRATLYGTKPLQARIGSREDLKIDSRYFVYAYKLKANGDTVRQRKAVIRAKKVANNKLDAQGRVRTDVEPSEFYAITGVGIQPGMLLVEKRDLGLFVTAGYAFLGETAGFELRVDYMFSKSGFTKQPGWYIGGFIGGETSDEFGSREEDVSFVRLGAGLRKDHYLMSNVRVGIGLDGGLLTLSDPEIDDPDNEGLDEIGNAYLAAPNAELGIHVWHNIQLVGWARYFIRFSVEQGDNYEGLLSAQDILDDRDGLNLGAGIRVNF